MTYFGQHCLLKTLTAETLISFLTNSEMVRAHHTLLLMKLEAQSHVNEQITVVPTSSISTLGSSIHVPHKQPLCFSSTLTMYATATSYTIQAKGLKSALELHENGILSSPQTRISYIHFLWLFLLTRRWKSQASHNSLLIHSHSLLFTREVERLSAGPWDRRLII